jgi:hypothetical protein
MLGERLFSWGIRKIRLHFAGKLRSNKKITPSVQWRIYRGLGAPVPLMT